MANWKEASDVCGGSATKYGAPDVKKMNQLYNCVNVNVCAFCNSTECINEGNRFTFSSDMCGNNAFRIEGANVAFNYLFKTAGIAADRIITLPLLTGNDTAMFNAFPATPTNKTFVVDGAGNSITQGTPATGAQLYCDGTTFKPKAIRQTFILEPFTVGTCVTTGCCKYRIYMPYCFTVTDIYGTVCTPSTSGTLSIQVQQTNIDILSTAITIEACEAHSNCAVAQPVLADNTLDIAAKIDVDVDAAGTGTQGLKIYLVGYQRF